MNKSLLIIGMLSVSFNALTDSFIKVANRSNQPVSAIWQAGGCGNVVIDPADDHQFTVCRHGVVPPGYQTKYNFSFMKFDRSVKVWGANSERIGYCNSMDDETLTVTGTTVDDQKTTGCE